MHSLNIMRALSMALVAALPAVAQDAMPKGWLVRTDAQSVRSEPADVRSDAMPKGTWRFSEMAPGFHLTTSDIGATLVPVDSRITGRRAAQSRVILFPGTSNEGYGLALADLDRTDRWMGLLVRRNGEAAVISHTGARETVLVPWKRFPSIHLPDSTGMASNELRLEVAPEGVTLFVNGSPTVTMPSPEGGMKLEVGFRAGRDLNMHVTTFDLITTLATPAPKKGNP